MPKPISELSVERIKGILQVSYPKAVSMSYLREFVQIRISSIRKICEEFLKKDVEVIETTAGRMYRWKGK